MRYINIKHFHFFFKTVKVRPSEPRYKDEIKAAKRLRRRAQRSWTEENEISGGERDLCLT